MVAADSEKRRQPTAHREGHIHHPGPRVKGTWSSRFVTSSFYLHDGRKNFPTNFAQRKYTLIITRCSSSSPSYHSLIAEYDAESHGRDFFKVSVPGAGPFKLICYGLTALSTILQ